jgi:hypothetical protein
MVVVSSFFSFGATEAGINTFDQHTGNAIMKMFDDSGVRLVVQCCWYS